MFFGGPATIPAPSVGIQQNQMSAQNQISYSNYNNCNYYGQNRNCIQEPSTRSTPYPGSAIPNSSSSYNSQQVPSYTSKQEQQLQYSSQPAPANQNRFYPSNNPKQTFLPSNTRDLSSSSNQTAATLPQLDSLIADSTGNLRSSDATFQNLISQLSEATKSITNIVKDLKEYKDQHLNTSRSRSTTGIMQQSSGMTNSFDIALGQLKQNLPGQKIPNNTKTQNPYYQLDQKTSQISSISQLPQAQNPCFFNNSQLTSQIQQMLVSQYPPKTYILQSPEDQPYPENSARIPSTSSIYLPPSPNSVSSQINQQQIYAQREYNVMPKKVAVDLSAANSYKFSKNENDLSGENIQGSQSARSEEKRQPREKTGNMTKSYFNGSQTIISHRFLRCGEEALIEQEKKEEEQFEMRKSAILSKRIRSYTTYNEDKQSQSQQLAPLVMSKFEFQGKIPSQQKAFQN